MRKIFIAMLLACITLFSCNTNTPEDYFGKAALNCNLLYGFAGYELKRDLGSPSEKLIDEKTLATAPMKRAEVVKNKITTLEENFEKVKSLGSNAEADEMLKASKALYEYVLPVYKNEYQQLAALYDNAAAADKIKAMEKSINEKYEPNFLKLYDAVWQAGKVYASKNGIKVQEVNPSPSGN